VKNNTIAVDVSAVYDNTGARGLTESGNRFVEVKESVKL